MQTANNGQFIQCRLFEIRGLPDVNSWYYVPSDENPADIPSRGLRVGDRRESQLWWQGSVFLKREEWIWSSNEVRKGDVCTTVAVVECSSEVGLLSVVDCRRCSKYSRFVKVVELVLSVLEGLRKMRFSRREKQTEKMILLAVQKAGLQEELQFLEKQESISLRGSKSFGFCINGRVDMVSDKVTGGTVVIVKSKNPILLPAGEYITDLVIMHFHERVNHRSVYRQRTQGKILGSQGERAGSTGGQAMHVVSSGSFHTHRVDFVGPLYLEYFDPEAGTIRRAPVVSHVRRQEQFIWRWSHKVLQWQLFCGLSKDLWQEGAFQ